MNITKWVLAAISVIGMFVAFWSICIMVIVPDWTSFTAAFIGMALIAIGAFGFKALDRQQA